MVRLASRRSSGGNEVAADQLDQGLGSGASGFGGAGMTSDNDLNSSFERT
jgi:hypothetical protein